GFGPSGASVATLMGDQARKEKERRPAPGTPPKRPADPIFSKPYEPSATPPAAKPEPQQQPQSRRKRPQVAALLGGLKRA
ncbi:MAG: hypothetical protein ACREVB_03385, partial [Burkholderiales bacterium]